MKWRANSRRPPRRTTASTTGLWIKKKPAGKERLFCGRASRLTCDVVLCANCSPKFDEARHQMEVQLDTQRLLESSLSQPEAFESVPQSEQLACRVVLTRNRPRFLRIVVCSSSSC